LGVVTRAIGPAGCGIGAGPAGHLAALAAGRVGIVAEVVSRVFSGIGNMLGHQGNPLQGVEAQLSALGRPIVDGAAGRVVFDPAGGEDDAAYIGAQVLQGGKFGDSLPKYLFADHSAKRYLGSLLNYLLQSARKR